MKRDATPVDARPAPAAIPLRWAMLCLNCDTISELSKDGCPACASYARVPLATWLNRVEAEAA